MARVLHLAYYVVGGRNFEYVELLRVSVRSLVRFVECHVLVICDATWEPVVRESMAFVGDRLHVHVCDPNADHIEASMRKVEYFDWPRAEDFDAVLYLDCDTVVTRDPTPLFRRISKSAKSDTLCVCPDVGSHTSLYFSLQDYTDEELARLDAQGIRVFNAGQFGFSPRAARVRDTFADIRERIAECKRTRTPYFYEQSFMNRFFNARDGTDRGALLEDATVLYAYDKFRADKTIHHVCDASIPFRDKLAAMVKLFDYSQCTVLDTRTQVHELFPPGSRLRVAEIGVFLGDYAAYLLTLASELHLVDPWQGSLTSGDQDGNRVVSVDGETAYRHVVDRFAGDPRVVIHRDRSQDVLPSLRGLDLVYIDGDHTYEAVRADLDMAWDAVVDGGWIVGHDYAVNADKTKERYEFGVARAVAEFCESRGQRVAMLAMDGCVSFGIKIKKEA